jgi:hypothetical protein
MRIRRARPPPPNMNMSKSSAQGETVDDPKKYNIFVIRISYVKDVRVGFPMQQRPSSETKATPPIHKKVL